MRASPRRLWASGKAGCRPIYLRRALAVPVLDIKRREPPSQVHKLSMQWLCQIRHWHVNVHVQHVNVHLNEAITVVRPVTAEPNDIHQAR